MLSNLVNTFLWRLNNYGAPFQTPGTSITPGISNAEGAWTQIIAPASVDFDIWSVYVHFYNGAIASTNKASMADIGIDPAGGSSYVEHIPNIFCGSPCIANIGGLGRMSYYPIGIPAGSSVACRIKGIASTATVIRCMIKVVGRPVNPAVCRRGSYVTTTGTVTNTVGTAFTPGSSGANGTWVSLGTMARPAWYHVVQLQISNPTLNPGNAFIDLACGDSTNKKMIVENMFASLNGTSDYMANEIPIWGEMDLPAGTQLWVRGSFSAGTPSASWSAVATSVGGDA